MSRAKQSYYFLERCYSIKQSETTSCFVVWQAVADINEENVLRHLESGHPNVSNPNSFIRTLTPVSLMKWSSSIFFFHYRSTTEKELMDYFTFGSILLCYWIYVCCWNSTHCSYFNFPSCTGIVRLIKSQQILLWKPLSVEVLFYGLANKSYSGIFSSTDHRHVERYMQVSMGKTTTFHSSVCYW